MSDDKATVMTITVYPLKGSKRPVLISAAPAGEMPIVRRGVFPEMHDLINQAWAELLRRKPMVVTMKDDKKKDKRGQSNEDIAKTTFGQEFGDDVKEDAPSDQLVTEMPADEDLPAIEGDTTIAESDDE